MTEAKPYPLDFAALQRGSVVTAEEIAEITGKRPGTDNYSLAAMRLAGMVKKYFRDERGDIVSVTVRKHSIVVLDHQEQDRYVQTGKRRALGQFVRRHKEDLGTDERRLDDESKTRRRRRLLVDSWKLQQLRKQDVPQLPKGKGNGKE